MNKLLITGVVTGAISLISIPFVSKKQEKELDKESIQANDLYDNDKSPLFI